MSQVTDGAMGAAVYPVLTARCLGHRAAAPGAVQHDAARGGVWALELAPGALDSSQGVVSCRPEAGSPIRAAVEAPRAAVTAIRAGHSLRKGAAAGGARDGEDAGGAVGAVGTHLAGSAQTPAQCRGPFVRHVAAAAVAGSSRVQAAGLGAALTVGALCSSDQPCHDGHPAHQGPHGLPANTNGHLSTS